MPPTSPTPKARLPLFLEITEEKKFKMSKENHPITHAEVAQPG